MQLRCRPPVKGVECIKAVARRQRQCRAGAARTAPQSPEPPLGPPFAAPRRLQPGSAAQPAACVRSPRCGRSGTCTHDPRWLGDRLPARCRPSGRASRSACGRAVRVAVRPPCNCNQAHGGKRGRCRRHTRIARLRASGCRARQGVACRVQGGRADRSARLGRCKGARRAGQGGAGGGPRGRRAGRPQAGRRGAGEEEVGAPRRRIPDEAAAVPERARPGRGGGRRRAAPEPKRG